MSLSTPNTYALTSLDLVINKCHDDDDMMLIKMSSSAFLLRYYTLNLKRGNVLFDINHNLFKYLTLLINIRPQPSNPLT